MSHGLSSLNSRFVGDYVTGFRVSGVYLNGGCLFYRVIFAVMCTSRVLISQVLITRVIHGSPSSRVQHSRQSSGAGQSSSTFIRLKESKFDLVGPKYDF